VGENIYLGQEAEFTRLGLIDRRRLNAAARRQLDKVEVDIDPRTRTSELSFAARQMVELAKALALEERTERHLVILLDEPTSVLETARYRYPVRTGSCAQAARQLRVRVASTRRNPRT